MYTKLFMFSRFPEVLVSYLCQNNYTLPFLHTIFDLFLFDFAYSHPPPLLKKSGKFFFSENLKKMVKAITYRGPIRNAPYKKHLGKIGDFDGGPYKKHFQNWQFDVSLLENFQKRCIFFAIFSKIFENFSKIYL